MRQCLSCSSQFDDALTACTNCGGQRSFLVAGSARGSGGGGGGGAGGGIGAAVGIGSLADLPKAIMSPDWSPNGIVWAGIGMLAVNIPSAIGLYLGGSFDARLGIISDFFSFCAVINIGMGVALILQQEWVIWFARLTNAFSIGRNFFTMRWYLTLGLYAGAVMHLLALVLLVCCQVMIWQGSGNSGSRHVIRFMLPTTAVFWIMLAVAIGTGSDFAINGSSSIGKLDEDPVKLQKEGITRTDDGKRVVDSLLCCSWCPPPGWAIERSQDGDAGGEDASRGGIDIEDMQVISLEVDFPEGTAAETAQEWYKDFKGAPGTTAPEPFRTTSGISGFHARMSMAGAGGNHIDQDVYFLPGHNQSIYQFTVHMFGDASRAIDADAVVASFRLEKGSPTRPEESRHHRHRDEDDEPPAAPSGN